MRSKTSRTETWRRAAIACVAAAASMSSANAAVFHTQRLHNPANTGGQGVEIEPYGGGFVYLANHTSPYLLPLSLNERPTLVFTDSALTAAASYTFMRPNETTQLLPTQLYLDSRDFAKTADGGFIICGNYAEGDAANGGGLQYGAFLLRVDGLSLQPLWFRQYPATDPNAYVSDIQFNSVVETSIPGGGGFVVAGQITDTLLNEALIAGFDSLGNPLWTRELTSFDGGFGVATEVINYDAESVAVTGYAGGRPHVHCQNNLAHADVLVARFQNDGTPLFVSLYGQSIGVVNETVASFGGIGASRTRPNGSPGFVQRRHAGVPHRPERRSRLGASVRTSRRDQRPRRADQADQRVPGDRRRDEYTAQRHGVRERRLLPPDGRRRLARGADRGLRRRSG
ncbi:MAG: hypothetical protein HZB38_01995 [Planctomycetes bacterium]|nr:hypothetical protein [Planctomycetota bacterium]